MARRSSAGWRKVAYSSWGPPLDPQIYGDVEVDATELLAFIDEVRQATGAHVTVTHAVGRAVAHALSEHPDVNVRLQGGRFVPRDSVDIFFVASIAGGEDLSGIKVERADEKPIVEIAEELAGRVERLRSGDHDEASATGRSVALMPPWLLRRVLRLATWLTSDRGVDLKRLGMPRQPFGSAMVTSVGMFGVQHAYGPLSPLYRVGILALVSEVVMKPVVVADEIVARPILTVSATLDHRYVDGAHAARLARSMRAYLERPSTFEDVPRREPLASTERG